MTLCRQQGKKANKKKAFILFVLKTDLKDITIKLHLFKCFYVFYFLQMAPGTAVLQMGCSGSRQRVRVSSATCQSRTLAAVQTLKRSGHFFEHQSSN